MRAGRNGIWVGAAVCSALALVTGVSGKDKDRMTAERKDGAVVIRTASGAPVLRYLFGKLPDGERAPAVDGTCFTHPLHTPSGDVVTDLAPADHPHHRGVFCAWVE